MSSAGGDDANNNNDNPASAAAGAKSNNTTAISAPVWRNPSAAHMQKYGLVALPADFQPTPQEQMLLDMYETVKNLERAAAKIREDAARAKLDARKVEFQQKQMAASTKDSNRGKDSSNNKKKDKKKKPHRHKRVKTLTAEDDAVDDDDDDDDVDVSDDDSEMEEEEEGKDGGDGDDNDSDDDQEKRKAAEIAALRADVEDRKKQAAVETNKASEEDARRAHHLATADEAVDDDLIGGGPVMRKKEKRAKLNADGNDDNDTAGAAAAASSALIDSLADASATPPHDFSKSLGLSPLKGMVLFPNRFSQENKWTPPTEKGQNPNEGAFMAELEDFDVTKVQQQQQQQSGGEQQVYNNTLAVKFAVPADSRRFSINIALASEQNNDFESILFHFNPRQRERGGQLIVNDKQDGIWGQAIAVPLSQIPMIFGQTSCTLLVQITGEGFDIFIDQQHCCRLEHRTELPSSPNSCKLVVQFPVSDDYGMPEKWTVYKVWWGHVKPLAKDDVSGVPGVKSFNALHPRKLFVTGLTKVYTQADVDVRRAELERAFRKYGGGRGAIVIVPTNSTYAFVELESESATDRALREMASTYSLNRARRTKHEALQEERAAKEAKARGETGQKQRSDWD